MMRIDVLTPFPAMCSGIIDQSILKRARAGNLVEIIPRNLRDWTTDRHRTTDDTPYGGGPGMVMKIEPIAAALQSLRTPAAKILLMSPQGVPFNQQKALELSREEHLIFVCGHYEGIDQRVADHLVDEEISIGDYVLTNGVLPALVVIDALVRLIPGALGDADSAAQESFVHGQLDYPHFTKPPEFSGWKVPEVLLSGNHEAIRGWRQARAAERTRLLRPDLPASHIVPPP
jgi:tRNA (guanine37-N1)-methyltransferase